MNREIRILSYNIWNKNTVLGASKAVDERTTALAQLLGPKLKAYELDAIVFSEAFNYTELLDALRVYCNDLEHSNPIPANVLAGKPLNGGVLIVTNHKIVKQGHIVYEHSLPWDSMAAKGVTFAEIELRTPELLQTVFVFGTHLQSNEIIGAGSPEQIRQFQLRQMRTFIDRTVPTEPAAPVLFAGDFNIDLPTSQYADMLNVLSARHGERTGLEYTCHKDNDWTGPDQKPEYLDYALASIAPQHKLPVSIGRHEVIRFRANVKGYGVKDLSDHYAVNALFMYDLEEITMTDKFVDFLMLKFSCDVSADSGFLGDGKTDLFFIVTDSGGMESRIPSQGEWEVQGGAHGVLPNVSLWRGNVRARNTETLNVKVRDRDNILKTESIGEFEVTIRNEDGSLKINWRALQSDTMLKAQDGKDAMFRFSGAGAIHEATFSICDIS